MCILTKFSFYKSVLLADMTKMAELYSRRFKEAVSTIEKYLGRVENKTILDVGCGLLYPFTLLFKSLGNRVIGIDLLYIGVNDSSPRKYWRMLRKNGPVYFARSVSYDVLLKNRAFYKHLEHLSNIKLTSEGIDVRQMDVEKMAFHDETFDIVFSNAVLEHVYRVDAALDEIKRVLKKGGIAYNLIHLFPSISGGHHSDWRHPEKVPPWNHLRENKCRIPFYLNKLRECDYPKMFRERFKILEVQSIFDEKGRNLLTSQIRSELQDYSEEELLKGGIIVVARR